MEEVKDSKHPAVGNILVSLGELFINVDDKTHESVPILSRAVSIFRPMKYYRRNVRELHCRLLRKASPLSAECGIFIYDRHCKYRNVVYT